jgi:hypothetical protein
MRRFVVLLTQLVVLPGAAIDKFLQVVVRKPK